MKRIFFDYTSGSLGNKRATFHGGADFSRYVLWKMHEYEINCPNQIEVHVLWPKSINESNLLIEERKIYDTFISHKIESYDQIECSLENDIVFLPMIEPFSTANIGEIKNCYPKVKVYAVLHGMRLHDVCKFDKYDKYYYSGIKSNSLILWVRRRLAWIIAVRRIKKYIPIADRIYTVSNNSMQLINKYTSVKYLKYFLRNISDDKKLIGTEQCFRDEYILFVNANRYEKNLVRTLIAYTNYIARSGSKTRLLVLGCSDELKDKLEKVHEIRKNVLESNVDFKGYVSTEELNNFYANCKFLLYTSKSEGFGLPPLEAMSLGRPTVASSLTSIPEVLGMAAYYVDPYDARDIEQGIAFMDDDKNCERYSEIVKNYALIISNRGDEDIRILIEEILG